MTTTAERERTVAPDAANQLALLLTANYPTLTEALIAASRVLSAYLGSGTVVSVWLLPQSEWENDRPTFRIRRDSALNFPNQAMYLNSYVDEQKWTMIAAYNAILGAEAGCLLPSPMGGM